MRYPAITIHQPWASWISWRLKSIETRTHNRFASLKGQRIAIHAGKAWDRDAETMARRATGEHLCNRFYRPDLGVTGWRGGYFPPGVVMCLATVEDIRTLAAEDSSAALCAARGLTGLILADVEPLAEPFKVRGRQGIWRVELPE